MEESGRIELSDEETNSLASSKNAHTALIMATVPLMLVIIGGHLTNQNTALFGVFLPLPFLPFWLGGLSDARRPTAAATATAACHATLETLAGFTFICILWVFQLIAINAL
eukprot:SAG31_NODE_4330_length_3346_cov_2.558054_1_plen_111_part_00